MDHFHMPQVLALRGSKVALQVHRGSKVALRVTGRCHLHPGGGQTQVLPPVSITTVGTTCKDW